MLHFVTSYMKQNKSRKQTLESAQCGLEISFNWDDQSYLRIILHNPDMKFYILTCITCKTSPVNSGRS